MLGQWGSHVSMDLHAGRMRLACSLQFAAAPLPMDAACLRARFAAGGAVPSVSAPDSSRWRIDDTSALRCASWVSRCPIRLCTAEQAAPEHGPSGMTAVYTDACARCTNRKEQ